MTMFDEIDPRSPTPLYEQIAARIRVAVAAGDLAAGEALPSVRKLARELRVNPATVVQAYRDLAADGFVEMRHGQGTFIQEVSPFLRDEERATRAQELVRKLLIDAARLGIGADEIARAFHAEIGVEIHE
ncbi:MAG: GntR family transcriptional regulator [Gemmatimonadetes bacterium]|nr:GntR family transcriptional regulator [Gemmatimonadota bacterium]NNF12172.1 GntR family transcriptional regulator [Gemmatimonadota bacterium]